MLENSHWSPVPWTLFQEFPLKSLTGASSVDSSRRFLWRFLQEFLPEIPSGVSSGVPSETSYGDSSRIPVGIILELLPGDSSMSSFWGYPRHFAWEYSPGNSFWSISQKLLLEEVPKVSPNGSSGDSWTNTFVIPKRLLWKNARIKFLLKFQKRIPCDISKYLIQSPDGICGDILRGNSWPNLRRNLLAESPERISREISKRNARRNSQREPLQKSPETTFRVIARRNYWRNARRELLEEFPEGTSKENLGGIPRGKFWKYPQMEFLEEYLRNSLGDPFKNCFRTSSKSNFWVPYQDFFSSFFGRFLHDFLLGIPTVGSLEMPSGIRFGSFSKCSIWGYLQTLIPEIGLEVHSGDLSKGSSWRNS